MVLIAVAVLVASVEAEFAAAAAAEFAAAAIVVHMLTPVRVVASVEAEMVELEPVDEVLLAVADETAPWEGGIMRGPDGTEDSENRIAG